MNVDDENSCVTSYPQECIKGNPDGRRKKGKRRSSILKMTKSPMRGLALDDIDPNTQSSDETGEKSKKSRRSASRRVSFAETCQIKEIPNEVKKRTWAWEDQFQNDENGPASVPEVSNPCGETSSYKQPASTLAGLSSLLSSPIQDSPDNSRQRYRQADAQFPDFYCNKVTYLDFTQCVDVDPGTNVSVNEMDMTLNNTARILVQEGSSHTRDSQTPFYQTETQQNQARQEPKSTSVYYDQAEQSFSEKTTSLEFTRCYGGAAGDGEDTTACNQMEITMNQAAANVLHAAPPHQHSASNVDSFLKVDASSFLRQLGAKDTVVERPLSLDFTRCYGEVAVGKDSTGDQMEFTANHGDGMIYEENIGHVRSNTSTKLSSNAPRQALQEISQDKNEVSTKMNAGYNLQYKVNEIKERPCDLRSAVWSDDMGSARKVDGSEFLRKLGGGPIGREDTVVFNQTLVNDDGDMEMTRCLSKSVAQGWNESKVDHQIRKDEDYEDMDTTRCLSKSKVTCLPKGEPFNQTLVNDDGDMEMTRCLQLSKSVAQGWNESKVDHQIHKDDDYEDMDTTRCLSKSKVTCLPKGVPFNQTLVNDDRDMEMTRCLSKGVAQGTNENSESASQIAIDDDRENMEMTRCLPNFGRNRSNGLRLAEDDGLCEDMDMTRCLSKAQGRNENQVAPQVAEDCQDMEMTKCLAKSGVQSTRNESNVRPQVAADMDMTRCLPEVQGKNERKFGPRVAEDEDCQDMEMTKCLAKSGVQSARNESNVTPQVAADMDMTRCLPEVQGNNSSKFGPRIAEGEDSHNMDMLGCLNKGERQGRNSSRKVGAQTVEDNDSPDMEMTCHQPVKTMSGSETLPVAGDDTGLAKYGVEAKLKGGDDARSKVTEQTKDIEVNASYKKISLHTEGTTTTSDKSFASVATSTDEPRRLREWSIDLTRFSKEHAETATHDDDDAVNRETPNVIGPVAGRGGDLNSNDALKERPHADSNLRKQFNMERKAGLNLSVNEGMKVKRRAMDGGQTKDPACVSSLGSDEVNAVPRLSKTLPLKTSAARVVPKKGTKAGVDANSTWTGPGTHEVVHVGRSIFAAKGPVIGPKLSLLNRRPNARAADVSDAKSVVSVPCNVVNVDSLIEKSVECETLSGSSIERVDAPGDCQLKSPCKESGTVSGVHSGLSNESVCATPVPPMNKSLSGSLCGDSLIMDEKIPDEISEMEAETEGGNIVLDAEGKELQQKDNLEQKGPTTPKVFDLERPMMKRNLSVISEESSCYQKNKNDEDDDEGKTEECENDRELPNDDSSNSEQSYTLQEFLSSANVTFIKHVTRRSECPLQASDPCTEMKDIIVRESLAEAKFPVWDNVTKQLQAVIYENERLSSVKEQELNRSNPTVFSVLKRSLAMDTTSSDVVEKIMALKRACRHSALEYWYGWRIEMDEQVLGLLKEQEKNVSDDISLLENHEKDLDGDVRLLDQITVDFDEKIHDLEVALESEEKSWDERKEEIEESRKQLEDLELELQSQEKQREQLASENDNISCQITDKKNRKTELESSIHSLEELTLAASNLEETMAEVKLMRNVLEWELEKHDANSMKFTFLYGTFELDISFKDSDVDSSLAARIKHVNIVSCISEDSSPLAHFCHQLVVEKFSQCDFVQMFPSRDKLPELLHIVSRTVAKVRMLLEDIDIISINHIVSFYDKLFTVDFSSLKNFIKFVITFDLSNIVEDGTLPRTVVKKIGTISSDVIAKKLNNIPTTVLCLSKVFKAADEFLS